MAMTELGAILSIGAHVPRLRLSRSVIQASMAWMNAPARDAARGARAICNWDEDALTMAVDAARACLGGRDAEAVPSYGNPQSISLCSTTMPFADRDDAVLVAAALDLPDTTQTTNFGASLRAGVGALISASHHADGARTLVAVSEARLARPGSPQELTYGDAAVAMLIGAPNPAAIATVIGTRSQISDFVDHYRMQGVAFDYALEERWTRDESMLRQVPQVISELLSAAGQTPQGISHLIVPVASSTAKRIAEACGMPTARRDERVLAECGDAGAALPLLQLAATLEESSPGELIVLVGLGQGFDAVLLRAEAGVLHAHKSLTRALDRKREEPSYVRYLAHRGLIDVDFGMRAERDQRTAHTVAYRKRGALSGFKGGRCTQCDTVQFPQSRVCVNPTCRTTDTQLPYRLADSVGHVKSFTEDWQAYAARPPYVYGNVGFSEGGNLLMEFTEIESGELQVNDQVRFVFRIKDDDRARGFRRYFWKATRA